jgi:putative oxidoreductase
LVSAEAHFIAHTGRFVTMMVIQPSVTSSIPRSGPISGTLLLKREEESEKMKAFDFFEKHRDYGAVFIRVIVGTFIIYGVQDNVFSYERMEEFAKFLEARGTPLPLFSAFVSVYTQFICGILIILGAAIRLAAIAFIINFTAALIIAHRADTFDRMYLALVMLFSGFFFLFNGAGALSVDRHLEKKRNRQMIAHT